MMDDWPFTNGKTIIGLKLLEMIDWVNESSRLLDGSLMPESKPVIALPPIQRSAVWRPKQVVDLWDSLIRGLPIGTFYLVKYLGGPRVTFKGKTKVESLPGYDLLDGQQRIRALLIGAVDFPEEKRCLWVDLGSEEAKKGPILRITSKGQPFGYDARTGNKLSLEDRKKARKRLAENGELQCREGAGVLLRAYDRELFEDEVIQGGYRIPQPPLPYGASEHTFKLPELLTAWQAALRECEPRRDDGVAALRTVAGNGPSQEALISLHDAFKRIKNAEVALLRIDPERFLGGKDDLRDLFDRIGAGGTPLSVEERLYSIYKSHVPYIRDAVDAIHRQAGRVLSPTKIAATAIRIAYAEAHSYRNDTPDVATFSKAMDDPNETNFKNNLKTLVPIGSLDLEGKGALLLSFLTVGRLLRHEEGIGHFWIPEVLLVSLPAELWQVLAYWAWKHPNIGNSKVSREEVVRFSLFWHFAVLNNEKAARWAFDYIKNDIENLEFPGVALYELFIGSKGNDHCAHKLVLPEEFERRQLKEATSKWRTDAERFIMENDVRNEIGSHWWWSGKKMLPWLQRDYIRRVFPGYAPLTDHEDDVPYDVDHMCPSKDWGEDWRILQYRLDIDKSLVERVRECREAVGGAIGNLQLLESSENRGYQAGDVADKMPFILRDDEPPNVEDAKHMADFAFAPKDRKLWKRVSRQGPADNRKWNEDRLEAFQQAVEQRAAWLYRRFHDDLGYELWTKG